ncbi:MAG: Rho termination factor N-terminal domain-containing protein, partial [Propionibacteriales bacterium]|nr:Rho termination factor N-terminal domain-containing protein [Propionibacteriales bacterium]
MHSGHRPDLKGIHVTEATTITPGAGAGSSAAEAASTPRPKSGRGLNGKVLAELQQVAGGLGISGTAKMRKSVLIEAIQAAQNGTPRVEAT